MSPQLGTKQKLRFFRLRASGPFIPPQLSLGWCLVVISIAMLHSQASIFMPRSVHKKEAREGS